MLSVDPCVLLGLTSFSFPPAQMPGSLYFGEALAHAVSDGAVGPERLDDMVRRMLWAMFNVGMLGQGGTQVERHRRLQAANRLNTPATR